MTHVAVLLFSLLTAPLPTTAAPPVAGDSITGGPSISAKQIAAAVASRRPLEDGEAEYIFSLSRTTGVDAAFALAVWQHESGMGTTGAARDTRNMGNIEWSARCHCQRLAAHPRWRAYHSFREAEADWFALVSGPVYVGSGNDTVARVITKYAPPVENDTAAYIREVRAAMKGW